MQFPTVQFLLFFIVVFTLAVALKESRRAYKVFLLAVSLFFYTSFGKNFIFLLLANIIVNYLLIYATATSTTSKKKFMLLGVIVNVVFLGFFKYYNFFIDTLLQTLSSLQIPANIGVLDILVPVGISFFTFRNISHIVDIYRAKLPLPKFIDFANYVAFFPQIMSGPITRAKEFYLNLNNPSLLSYSQGRIIVMILSGLIKKFVIASYLYQFTAGTFATPENYSSIDLIISALAYSAMIFVDFSGYSDFAIAISNMLGFEVPENFNSPYRAIGLRDFWARWHISLSQWLKDYVYIPLGGNRKGTLRKFINLFLTMVISGLWHGAGLNYIIWGALHGIGTVVTHLIEGGIKRIKAGEEQVVAEVQSKFTIIIRYFIKFTAWLMTFTFVTFAWIFFTAKDLDTAVKYVSNIFTSSITNVYYLQWRLLAIILAVILFNFIGKKAFIFLVRFFNSIPLAARIIIVSLVVYVLLNLGPETMPPFIYFNF